MDRWISRAACALVLVALWSLSGAVEASAGEFALRPGVVGQAAVALCLTLVALALALRSGLAERWVLAVLLLLEVPVAAAGVGFLATDSASPYGLVVALAWAAPLPLLVSFANEPSPPIAARPARVAVVLGSVAAAVVLFGGGRPEPSDGLLTLVGVLCAVLAVLAAALSAGRLQLVWFGAPTAVLAAVTAYALLGPPDEGILLPFLVTTPTACGWAIFAVAAWNLVGSTPVPATSGGPPPE